MDIDLEESVFLKAESRPTDEADSSLRAGRPVCAEGRDRNRDRLRAFVCAECRRAFAHRKVYERHVRTPHGALPADEASACRHCGLTFTTKGILKTHVKTIHQNVRDFPCPQCGRAFSQRGNLENHIHTVHRKLKQFVCRECERIFAQNIHLKVHLKNVHGNNVNYSCKHCKNVFLKNWHLEKHLKKVHKIVEDSEKIKAHRNVVQSKDTKRKKDASDDNCWDSSRAVKSDNLRGTPFFHLFYKELQIHLLRLGPFECTRCKCALDRNGTLYVQSSPKVMLAFSCSVCRSVSKREDSFKRNKIDTDVLRTSLTLIPMVIIKKEEIDLNTSSHCFDKFEDVRNVPKGRGDVSPGITGSDCSTKSVRVIKNEIVNQPATDNITNSIELNMSLISDSEDLVQNINEDLQVNIGGDERRRRRPLDNSFVTKICGNKENFPEQVNRSSRDGAPDEDKPEESTEVEKESMMAAFHNLRGNKRKANTETGTTAPPAPPAFQCSQYSSTDLKKHYSFVRNNKKPFLCLYCHRRYVTKDVIKAHIDKEHKRLIKFDCRLCGRAFAQKGGLKSHYDAIHRRVQKFACSECHEKFKLKTHLSAHMRRMHAPQ